MKQCTSEKASRYNSMSASSFTEDEIEVADILFDLPNLISKSESRRRGGVPVNWAIRKKRSVPSSPRRVNVEIEQQQQQQQQEAITIEPHKVKAESTSPLTPLCFYPSESDEKSKLPLKNSNPKKRKREEWLEIIDGLTRCRELLRGELENERSRSNKLKSFNLALKAKKQEASSFGLKKDKSELGMGKRGLNVELKLDHHYQNTMFAHQQQQLIINHAIYESQAAGGRFQYPNHHVQVAQFLSSNSGGLSGTVNHVGPLGIPDLNLCVEEAFGLDSCQPLDQSRVLVDERVMWAEARRRRMIKIKEMKRQQRGR